MSLGQISPIYYPGGGEVTRAPDLLIRGTTAGGCRSGPWVLGTRVGWSRLSRRSNEEARNRIAPLLAQIGVPHLNVFAVGVRKSELELQVVGVQGLAPIVALSLL